MANLVSLAGLRKLMLIMLIVWCFVMVASGKLLSKYLTSITLFKCWVFIVYGQPVAAAKPVITEEQFIKGLADASVHCNKTPRPAYCKL